MKIGRKIKDRRHQLGLTQKELADRCELTKGYISQLENDLTSPSIATLNDIVSALGITLQEFFQRMTGEAKVWGVPASALLGAVYAQIGLGLGAIGGKDSMSGTFESIHVPPTLISFALAPAKASKLITNVLKGGETLYHIPVPKDEYSVPNFDELKKVYEAVFEGVANGNISFATVVENGGVGASVIKSALGNSVGVNFTMSADELYSEGYGDLVVSLKDEKALCACISKKRIGQVYIQKKKHRFFTKTMLPTLNLI